jgi:hypothetical protein
MVDQGRSPTLCGLLVLSLLAMLVEEKAEPERSPPPSLSHSLGLPLTRSHPQSLSHARCHGRIRLELVVVVAPPLSLLNHH